MLEVSGLEAGYGDGRVLFGVDLAVDGGEVVTLLGRNGMGKTTTLSTIIGIVRAEGGAIRFEGAPIHDLPPYRIARLGLGLVPEGRQIFPNLTVRENLVATARRGMEAKGRWTLDSMLDLFGRRTANAGDRARPDDKSTPAAARRSDRGLGAAYS